MKPTFNLSAWALAHQQLVSFFMLLIIATGVLCYEQLPRNEDPAFTIKTAVVSARWPGASVTDTTNLVTDTLEKKLQEIPWLDNLESETRAGTAVINVNLRDDTPPQAVPGIWNTLRDRMQDITSSLPEGVQGPVVNDEFDDTFGTIYGFTAEGYSMQALRERVEAIRRGLMSLNDVGKITLLGEPQEQIVIAFSPRKLAGMGLDITEVSDALKAQNAVEPAGTLRAAGDNIAIRVSGALTSEQSLRAVTLHISGRYIPLTDIATVSRQPAEPPVPQFRVNGQPAIGLAISMAPTGNMLDFGQALNARMAQSAAQLPHGIEMVKVADQSTVVSEAVSGFVHVLVEAVLIVLAVSFVSLGMRAGLVVAAAIPLVLAMTFAGMMLAGIGLQRISLGALIIALGLLVDDAMIAVETMVARLEAGDSRQRAATWAFKTTAFPMLTGTLVMIAGFIPVGFAASSAGEYCYSLFVVVTISLLCSWGGGDPVFATDRHLAAARTDQTSSQRTGLAGARLSQHSATGVAPPACDNRRRAVRAGVVGLGHHIYAGGVFPGLRSPGTPGDPFAARQHVTDADAKPGGTPGACATRQHEYRSLFGVCGHRRGALLSADGDPSGQ